MMLYILVNEIFRDILGVVFSGDTVPSIRCYVVICIEVSYGHDIVMVSKPPMSIAT
jgi:hypothetical protein